MGANQGQVSGVIGLFGSAIRTANVSRVKPEQQSALLAQQSVLLDRQRQIHSRLETALASRLYVPVLGPCVGPRPTPARPSILSDLDLISLPVSAEERAVAELEIEEFVAGVDPKNLPVAALQPPSGSSETHPGEGQPQ